ncbi:MAG: chemotaxis protein CheX [Verrucomicrobiales bacterium]
MAIDEKDLKIFIRSVSVYFQKVFSEPALVDPPFLHGHEAVIRDVTGVIGISGRHRGAVYFTTGRAMVREMLQALGVDPDDMDFAVDLVGEVTNTLAGNARREFGSKFLISVPTVIRSEQGKVSFPKNTKSFIIPFIWRHHRAHLIVCLTDVDAAS